MSLSKVRAFAGAYPPPIRDQVVDYARHVRDALPEIISELDFMPGTELQDQVVFIAGLRKLFALLSSTYWAVDNSLHFLRESSTTAIRAGALIYARNSLAFMELRAAYRELEEFLRDSNCMHRRKAARDSDGSRPLNPGHAVHGIRAKPARNGRAVGIGGRHGLECEMTSGAG